MFVDNISQVNFTSRYSIDKVIYRTSGSRSVTQAGSMADSVLITIPHTLGYAPLCIGQFAETSDFSTAYEFANPPYFFNTLFMTWGPRINAIVESDASNIYVRMINFDTTRTLYYRIIGLIPHGITSSPTMPTADRTNLLFNAQENFLKIATEGEESRDMSSGTPITVTIPHNLGYRPMALVYTQDADFNLPIQRSGSETQFGVAPVASKSYVDSVNLYVDLESFSPDVRVFYRIYFDI